MGASRLREGVSLGGVHARRSQLRVTPKGRHTWGGHKKRSHLGITSGGITPGEVVPVGHHITVLLRVWKDAQQGSPKSRVTPGCPWGRGSGAGAPADGKVWWHQHDRLALTPSLGTSRACWGIQPEDPKTRLAGSREVPAALTQMLPVCGISHSRGLQIPAGPGAIGSSREGTGRSSRNPAVSSIPGVPWCKGWGSPPRLLRPNQMQLTLHTAPLTPH